MADAGLSSEEWIKMQNAERESRALSAREQAEEMTDGKRRITNLDVRNKFIVEAGKKNMELTDEEHRDESWHEQYQIILDNLKAIEEYEAEHGS